MSIERDQLSVTGRFIKIANIKDEWHQDVDKPEEIIEILKKGNIRADIFTFWQRLPETKPKYDYIMEWDSIAVMKVDSYDQWLTRLSQDTRRNVRRPEKRGVVIRQAEFNDDFIRGMVEIFNESPIRQGRPFWHYGKNFEAVKKEFSRNLFRENIIGAFYKEELIGFIMLSNAGSFAIPTQIISKISHRDKAPTNGLIAEAVKMCAAKKIPYLVYLRWPQGSFAEFKRRNCFEKVDMPRYYVPLNSLGALAMKLRLHRGITGMMPGQIVAQLKKLREKIYEVKYGQAANG